MIDMLKRHEIQVLRQAGHDQADVARLVGVGIRSVRRIDAEPDVTQINDANERERRGIGRPSKAEPSRWVITEILAGEPDLLSVEVLRRAKLKGYTGGKCPRKRVHFFASRLKYSRWVEVTIVPDECAETLVRTLVDHSAAIGGIPLLAALDRATTVAVEWTKDGTGHRMECPLCRRRA